MTTPAVIDQRDQAETGDEPASPLSVSVTRAQREEITRQAAEYGARVGRPVPVSEYVRICVLGAQPADAVTS